MDACSCVTDLIYLHPVQYLHVDHSAVDCLGTYLHCSAPTPSDSGKLGRHGHIAVGELLHQACVWIVQHDVEVLDRMHALEAPPVLEPCIVLGLDLASERPPDERVDLLVRFRRRVARLCVVLELKLGPHDQVHNLVVDAVRPVVVQDLDVLF